MCAFQALTRPTKVSGKCDDKENLKLQNTNNANNNPMTSKNRFNNLANNISNYYPQINIQLHNSNSKINNQSCKKPSYSNVQFNFANIQTKLKVSQPSDSYEQEADRIAEQVMKMSISDPITSNMPQNHERVDRRKCQLVK